LGDTAGVLPFNGGNANAAGGFFPRLSFGTGFASLEALVISATAIIRITAADTPNGAQSENPWGAQADDEVGVRWDAMSHHRLSLKAEL
jgi:hypothetical protein